LGGCYLFLIRKHQREIHRQLLRIGPPKYRESGFEWAGNSSWKIIGSGQACQPRKSFRRMCTERERTVGELGQTVRKLPRRDANKAFYPARLAPKVGTDETAVIPEGRSLGEVGRTLGKTNLSSWIAGDPGRERIGLCRSGARGRNRHSQGESFVGRWGPGKKTRVH